MLKKQFNYGLVVSMLWMAIAAISARSQTSPTPPNKMTYQGFLTDGAGNPIGSNGSQAVNLIFKIYRTATGGTPVWAEQQMVTVDGGNFSVQLGEGAAVPGITNAAGGLSYAFSGSALSDRYVGLTMVGFGSGGTDVEITPRVRLLSAPYAHLATAATGLANTPGASTITFSTNGLTVAGTLSSTSLSATNMTVGNLVVTNSLTFSGTASGFVTSSDTSLRVVAGRHRWTNGVTFLTEPSPGYSVVRTAVGTYKITFDTAFNSVPNVVATPINTDSTTLSQSCDIVQSTDATVAKKEVTIRFNGYKTNFRSILYWNTGTIPGQYQNITFGGASPYLASWFNVTMPEGPLTQVDGDFCFLVMGN